MTVQCVRSADLTSSLPALLKVVKLVYSERKQLEKILKSTSIRQQDRVGHLLYYAYTLDDDLYQTHFPCINRLMLKVCVN